MTEAAPAATWTYDGKLRLLRITLRGAWPTAARTHRVVDTLRQAGFVTPDARLLIDVRGAIAAGAPHYDDMQGLIVPREDSPRRRAYLAASDWQVGVCRQLCVFWERPGFEARVFMSEPDALAWLTGNEQPRPWDLD
jgi:hypothetical protein